MSFLSAAGKRRAVGLAGACALALSGIASATIAGAGPANAATCTDGGAACVITGSADLTSGVLTATLPDTLTWSSALDGANLNVADVVAADQGYTVNDATATGAGWHVTLAATTFTCVEPGGGPTPVAPCTDGTGASPVDVLPNTGTFSTNGSATDVTDTTPPAQACTFTATPPDCTLPDNAATTYPVHVTTAASIGTATAETIYDAAVGTGIGSVNIGNFTGTPNATGSVGWWIHVPGTTVPGTYTSTINVNVISTP